MFKTHRFARVVVALLTSSALIALGCSLVVEFDEAKIPTEDAATDGGGETSVTDTGTPVDTGVIDDTGAIDDTGTAPDGAEDATDTGAADTGAADTGAADTGAADTGALDTGASDAEPDVVIDAPIEVSLDDASDAG